MWEKNGFVWFMSMIPDVMFFQNLCYFELLKGYLCCFLGCTICIDFDLFVKLSGIVIVSEGLLTYWCVSVEGGGLSLFRFSSPPVRWRLSMPF
jgi:hypothetical protein